MRATTFRAIEEADAMGAIEHARRVGGTAVSYAGKHLVAGRALVAALEAAARGGRAEFAYLATHAGRVVTVPVGR